MVFTWPYGEVNVEGSLNRYFRVQITAAGLPTWITGVTAYFDFPDHPITAFPCFTITHFGHSDSPIAQGNIVQGSPSAVTGRRNDGMLEVSCWVNTRNSGGGRNNSAMIQLRSMRDMVKRCFISAQTYGVAILDVYGATAAPTSISALVRMGAVEEAAVDRDPNPSVLRKRLLIDYWWVERY